MMKGGANPMSGSKRLLMVILLALLAAGCGPSSPAEENGRSTMSRSEFAEVFIELREAAVESDSMPEFEARRAEILQRHGIEADDLIEFVEQNVSDLQGMADTWDLIYKRLSSGDTVS